DAHRFEEAAPVASLDAVDGRIRTHQAELGWTGRIFRNAPRQPARNPELQAPPCREPLRAPWVRRAGPDEVGNHLLARYRASDRCLESGEYFRLEPAAPGKRRMIVIAEI